MPEHHEVQAVAHQDDTQVCIRCACGWQGESRASEAEAGDQYRRHLAEVGGAEPTVSE